MQEPMDSNEEAKDLIQEHSIEHYLMEHPKRQGETISAFDEGYQTWLKDCYLEREADRQLSLNKDAGEEWFTGE